MCATRAETGGSTSRTIQYALRSPTRCVTAQRLFPCCSRARRCRPLLSLPQELIQLAGLHALKLRDGDWEADVAKIVQRLEKLGAERVAGADSQPENVDGQALDAMLSTRGSLPENEALSIFRGVLEGLGFAHGKGIIHRDLKPSNILLDQSGRARITNFGIAILTGSQRLTATGLTDGTAWYMSPEQIRRPESTDQRSDIYSAGIVLYEMLTGSVPFDGDTDFSVKEQQINLAPPDPESDDPSDFAATRAMR